MSERGPSGQQQGQWMGQPRLIGVGVAFGLLLLFFLQNTQDATIHFLFFDWDIQMIWALVLAAALGSIGTFLGLRYWNSRRGRSS